MCMRMGPGIDRIFVLHSEENGNDTGLYALHGVMAGMSYDLVCLGIGAIQTIGLSNTMTAFCVSFFHCSRSSILHIVGDTDFYKR